MHLRLSLASTTVPLHYIQKTVPTEKPTKTTSKIILFEVDLVPVLILLFLNVQMALTNNRLFLNTQRTHMAYKTGNQIHHHPPKQLKSM